MVTRRPRGTPAPGTAAPWKEPVTPVLAGPYGHPFHPMLVTVPIGAWVGSVVLDVASRVRSDASLATGATWLLAIGVIGAVVAASVGFLDLTTIPSGTRAHRTAVLHMVVNLTVTGGFAADLAWRLGLDRGVTPLGPLVLSVVCLFGLGVGGALGGELAYRYGVRVAAEPAQAEGFRSAPTEDSGTDTVPDIGK